MEVSDKLEELFHIADKVAKRLAREYPSIDIEDINQELYLYCVENEDSIRLFNDSGFAANPVAILYREGSKYCNREITKSAHNVSRQEYTPDDVRKMLGDALVFQDVVNTYVPEWSKSYRPQGSRRAADTAMDEWDSIIVGTEVKTHMRYLRKEDREILFRRYVLEDPETKEVKTLAKRVERAVDRLAHELNKFADEKSQWHEEHPNGYPGARKAMGRSATQQASKMNYGGE